MLVLACAPHVYLRAEAEPPDTAAGPAAATAPGEKPEPPAYEDNVVVTASRGELPADRVPVSVSVINEKQIEEAAATRVDDLLREMPGLDLPLGSSPVQYPTQQTFSMRGLGGNRALVLLDGVPLNDAASGYIQWGKVPMYSLNRIEVARGAAASLFGNYSLGGTVQLFSRPLENRLQAEVSSGTNDTNRVFFSIGKAFGEQFAIGADIDVGESDGFHRVPEDVRGPIDLPVASDHETYQLKAEYNTSRARSYARASSFTENLSLGTPLSANSRDIVDFALGSHIAVGTGDLSVSVFHQDQEFRVQNTSLIRRDSEFVLNRRTTPITDTGGSIQWSIVPGGRVPFLTVGLDLRHIDLEEQGTNFNSAGNVVLLQTVGGTQQFAGLFAESSVTITPKLEMLLSARYDSWENQNGFDQRSDGTDLQYQSKSLSELDPRLALRYEISPTAALRGAVYRAFRAPTISELYRRTEAKAQVNLPNPSLEPEILVGGDIGTDARIAGANATLNLFYSEIDGLIGRIPIEITPILTQLTVNLGKTRSQGAEAMISRSFGPRWSAQASATYTDSTTISNPADPRLEGLWTPGVSRHYETASVRYQHPASFSVTVRGRNVGKRYVDAANLIELDAHLVFDLFASLPLGRSVELFLIGENLFDEVYLADISAAPRLGGPQQFFGGVRLRLNHLMD